MNRLPFYQSRAFDGARGGRNGRATLRSEARCNPHSAFRRASPGPERVVSTWLEWRFYSTARGNVKFGQKPEGIGAGPGSARPSRPDPRPRLAGEALPGASPPILGGPYPPRSDFSLFIAYRPIIRQLSPLFALHSAIIAYCFRHAGRGTGIAINQTRRPSPRPPRRSRTGRRRHAKPKTAAQRQSEGTSSTPAVFHKPPAKT